jgi:hypothetical protein
MLYNTHNYWVLGLCPLSAILKTRKQTFGNWICFLPQVMGETPTVLDPLERANLNVKVKVKVTLRLVVYHLSVRFGVKPFETHDQRHFCHLNPCGHSPYVISSLTRRWVCIL